jgi:hypothetical protein
MPGTKDIKKNDVARHVARPSGLGVRDDGHRILIKGGVSILAAALTILALGVWVAPGADWAEQQVLMKALLSIVSFGLGLACLQKALQPDAPRVEIDTLQHEVRLIRPLGRDRLVLRRCRFSDLGRVENAETHLRLWDRQGAFLAEVAAADGSSHRPLVTALKVAGKL